jgi:hypothetical protein
MGAHKMPACLSCLQNMARALLFVTLDLDKSRAA